MVRVVEVIRTLAIVARSVPVVGCLGGKGEQKSEGEAEQDGHDFRIKSVRSK